MRNFLKFTLALLVGLFLFYFVVKDTGIEFVLEALSFFFKIEGFFIILITFAIVLLGSLRWREILRSDGEEVSLLKTLRYLVKGFTVDFLTPFSLFGGEAVRIMLMEKEVGFKKSFFATATDKIMDITAHFFFLLLGTVFLVLYGASHRDIVLLYALAVIILIFLGLALFYRKALRQKSFLQWIFGILRISNNYLNNTKNGQTVIDVEKKIVFFFSSHKKEFAKGMILSFLRHFFFLLRVYLIMFFVIGYFDPALAVAIYGLTILSMLLPLPASIGGMEVILALGFAILGIAVAPAVILAVTLRGADLLVCIVGIALFIRLSVDSFLLKIRKFTKSG